jgi:hypothetical protein
MIGEVMEKMDNVISVYKLRLCYLDLAEYEA